MECIWTMDGSVYGPYMDPTMDHNGSIYGPWTVPYMVHAWIQLWSIMEYLWNSMVHIWTGMDLQYCMSVDGLKFREL